MLIVSLVLGLSACSQDANSITDVPSDVGLPPAPSVPPRPLPGSLSLAAAAMSATLQADAISFFAPTVSDSIRATFMFSTNDSLTVSALITVDVPAEMGFESSTLEIRRENGAIDRLDCPRELLRDDDTGQITSSAIRCHPYATPTPVTLRARDIAILRINGRQNARTTTARTMTAFMGELELRLPLAGWLLLLGSSSGS